MNWTHALRLAFSRVPRPLYWLIAVLGTGLAFLLGLYLIGLLLRPNVAEREASYPQEELDAAARARNVRFDGSDPTRLPRVQQPVDYAEREEAAWWPKGEAPILRELVQEGKLPPVAQRTGSQPVVLDGGEIGNYGGTWLRAANSDFDVFIVEFRIGYPSLFRWSPLGYPIVPHLALSMDSSEDKREYTMHLRQGVRWSDGEPFTADDILFWWEYEDTNEAVGDGSPERWMVVRGGRTQVQKLDTYTIRFRFEHPYGTFMEALAGSSYVMAAAPAHYMRKYHPETGDPAFIEREMKALQLNSPRALYARMKRFDNPECPRLWPWVPRAYSSNPPFVYVRNPYYFAVDPQGNQLPYIDRVQFEVKSPQMLSLTFANGEVTMQGRHVRYENYTELLTRQKQGGFRVLHWYPASRADWMIHPNLNRMVDPARPETAHKAALLADKRFRQALSLAVDRKTIIRAEYNDQTVPSQVEPGPESPFHSQKLAQAFIEHDPARANALLDELGLTHRDLDGMRTFPDGSTMTWYLNFSPFTGIGPGQFIVDDWQSVGVRTIAREQARTLFYVKKDSSDFDFMVWPSESDFFPMLEPRVIVPPDVEAFYASRWGRWFLRGGYYDSTKLEGVKNAHGPPPGHPMWRSYAAYVEAVSETTVEAQVERFSEALDIAAENLWTIGISEAPPFLVVVDEDLHNVPKNALHAAHARTPANAGVETYFFGNPSQVARAETKSAIENPVPLKRVAPEGGKASESAHPDDPTLLGQLLKWLLVGVTAAFLLLTGLKHPFVARRLVILVPTLLVISVIVFTIIQLPPGDYLTARIAVLQETGDAVSMAEIDDLKRQFHYDDPAWKQYARWMGLLWFTSFESADAGLLQGHMGYSMETGRPVNELVGDRVLLTIAISLASLLFTWALAVPIGVYSAVRQYSLGDYVFTFIGFIGMSVPPFLLALVLMVLSGTSGLFSAQFAAQPYWDWAKFQDLLRHVWIPVLVMGVSGTAGMIRVMRANLLDELKKPYVTTARAKGVRPLKLLFKYPVRVALNPFVSGIGGVFPHLVSGSAIVAIVLSLPTVGPLQVSALFNEDMYLAGSMLMVLSLLSVFGTLVADLLLLWLDPRIRYDGGGRE